MSGFISSYIGAFDRNSTMSIKRWIYFFLKSLLLFLLLLLAFFSVQYALITYTPLFEYVTVSGIKQSNVYGIILMLTVSFVSSVLHLVKIIRQ
jgi:TRAP-type C4-dicarboxylate transport system permease small subunit